MENTLTSIGCGNNFGPLHEQKIILKKMKRNKAGTAVLEFMFVVFPKIIFFLKKS